MNPLIVIAGFVIVLAILIYYLQSRETESEESPTMEKPEKSIVKVRDYVAQYNAEKAQEKPAEKPKTEVLPEESTEEPLLEEPEQDDIALLNGVGPKYQELLKAAGYTSIKAVAESSPETLYLILLKINDEKGITKRPPTLRNIEEWIKSASSKP